MQSNDYVYEFENLRIQHYLDLLPKPYYSISFKPWDMWLHPKTDFFKYLDCLQQLKNREVFLVIDWTDEGYSLDAFGIANQIEYNIKAHGIDPNDVIYLSSNLRDNKTAKENDYSFHVFGWDHFSYITHDMAYEVRDPKTQWEYIVETTRKNYEGKKFCSLSRVFRQHRCYGSFLLSTSKIGNQGLISHGYVKDFPLDLFGLNDKNKKKFQRWKSTLPLTIDRKDFSNDLNWQFVDEAEPIFTSTLFQIANESQIENENDTAMFITEKTFKSLYFMQPLMIFGQQYVNNELKEIGYRTYESYFDLSFDKHKEFQTRYQGILSVASKLVKRLNRLSNEEQIQWRFAQKDILLYNYEKLINSRPEPLRKFINDLSHTYK